MLTVEIKGPQFYRFQQPQKPEQWEYLIGGIPPDTRRLAWDSVGPEVEDFSPTGSTTLEPGEVQKSRSMAEREHRLFMRKYHLEGVQE